jgi:uncharacterized RDD family membrane protein YckC
MAAREVKAFADGTQYVPAGEWARAWAWLVDAVVVMLGFLAGVAVIGVTDNAQGLSGGVIVLGVGALVVGVPLLYGLCYTNGRALGALLTGTRLVRLHDGGRIGAKGPWAMLIRTLLLPLAVLAVITGGTADGTFRRVSIDVALTRPLAEDQPNGGVRLPPRGP